MDDFKAELAESFWEIERSNKVLRTKKDRDGDRWSEVAPDVWYSTPPMSLCELEEEFGPLTDVTDTGVPLDTVWTCQNCGSHDRQTCSSGAVWCNSCQRDEKDTPRKPEPGDRVRGVLVVEGTYMTPGGIQEDSGNQVWGFENAEVTVIEPARPAVPEEPPVGTVVIDGSGDAWQHNHDGWSNTQGGTQISWLDVLFDRPLYTVERGPVIGG